MRGKGPPTNDEALWHPQFAFTQKKANKLASGSSPADVCRPTKDGRVNLMVRLSLPLDFAEEGHDPDGPGEDCRPLAADWWQDVRKYYVRRARVFGLGDLFKELGDCATGKELHDIWSTCRIAANKRVHSGRVKKASGEGGTGAKGKKGKGKKCKGGKGPQGKGRQGKGDTGKKGKGKQKR